MDYKAKQEPEDNGGQYFNNKEELIDSDTAKETARNEEARVHELLTQTTTSGSNPENNTLKQEKSKSSIDVQVLQPIQSDDPQAKKTDESATKTEKFVASVLGQLLKTETGSKFLGRVITKHNTYTENPLELVKTRDINLIDKIFGVELEKNDIRGRRALCGHKVNLVYDISDVHGNILLSNTMDVTLGRSDAPIIVENLAINMIPGQTKKGIIPKEYLYTEDNKGSIVLRVRLNDILDSASTLHDEDLKIFDKYIGNRMPYMCGEKVSPKIKIIALSDNKVILDNIYELQTGAPDTPSILSYSIPGNFKENVRTVITKAKFLKNVQGQNTNLSDQAKLQDEALIMLEISD